MRNVDLFLAVFALLQTSASAWWIPYDVNSCVGRCNNAYDGSLPCQCNSECGTHGDCCADYHFTCLGADQACRYRCGHAYNPNDQCHCNSLCKNYNNCCQDYDAYCNITPGELSALAEDLWVSDESKASPAEYTLNKQAQVIDGNKVDQSPKPLFSFVDEAAVFSRPTFAAFIALLDNYNPQYGVNENVTEEERTEFQHFMDTIMATKTMTKTANFLISKGYFQTVGAFRNEVERIWFTLYDRSSPTDSSGFEHVFLGEYKGGSKVNGFHNWVQFYMKEKTGEINYLGYVREDTEHDLLGANFVWNGYNKALGSFMYGASVEFELAMMTTCFTGFGGKKCNFNLNGSALAIQTYTIHDNLVGSSYFVA